MEQHYCQRIPKPGPNTLSLTSIEGDPDACGKIAHFKYRPEDPYDVFEPDKVWWLCAECYDFAMIFDKF
jgi:hypothetical protein